MADLEELEELRGFVADSNDPDIVRERELLEGGEEQPVFESIATAAITEDIVEVPIGEFVEISFGLPASFFEAFGVGESRVFLVIRQRSLTDNTFIVRFQLGAEGSLASPDDPDREHHVVDVPFFDHVGGEHAPGDIVASDSPLGHFFIETTPILGVLREEGVIDSPVSLQIAPIEIHPEVRSEVRSFALGEVSLEVVPGVS